MTISADDLAAARDDLFPLAKFDAESQERAIYTFARTLAYLKRLEDDLRKERAQRQIITEAADKLARYVLRGNQWALSREFVEGLTIKVKA